MKHIATAGNVIVPALLALERLGFTVTVANESGLVLATRGEESYVAEEPIALLGLVKLIEIRGWQWKAADDEIEAVLRRYELG